MSCILREPMNHSRLRSLWWPKYKGCWPLRAHPSKSNTISRRYRLIMVNSARYRSDSLTSLSTPLSLSVSSRNSAYISPRGTRTGIQGGRNGFNSGVFRIAESETERRERSFAKRIVIGRERKREKKKRYHNAIHVSSLPNREQIKFNSSPFSKDTRGNENSRYILRGKINFYHPSIHPSCKIAPVFPFIPFSSLQWHQSVAKDSLYLVISSHDIYHHLHRREEGWTERRILESPYFPFHSITRLLDDDDRETRYK